MPTDDTTLPMRSEIRSLVQARSAATLVQSRNPGLAFDRYRIQSIRIDAHAVERLTRTWPSRRPVAKQWRAAWLLRALRCIDLTTLSGDDTSARVERLCSKAKHPLRPELITALELEQLTPRVAAVCVYHEMVATAVHALRGTDIPVAAVSTGFPHGLSPLPQRIEEIRASVAAGAQEIDIVITRAHAFAGRWGALYDEIQTYRDACGEAHLKVILATGDLQQLRRIAQAAMVCMMAGADFIKTSTGKESSNATLSVSLVMLRMIRAYHEATGIAVGFKPAGGIKTGAEAIAYLSLIKDELGPSWLEPNLFRIGASSLLNDIERQLEQHATGRFSAPYRQGLS